MASPHGGTHGSSSPATITSQPQYGFHGQQQQQQYQQQPEGGYDTGLMPTNELHGKEVVDPHVHQVQQMQQYQQQQNVPGHEQSQGYSPVYQQQQAEQPPAAPAADKRICGVRRTTFLLALLAAILLAGVIGAAAAAGVVASSNKGDSAAPASSSAPEDSSSSSTSSAPSATSSSAAEFTAVPLPEEPTGLGVTRPQCPSSNNTETEIPGTDLKFKHECGINYKFNDLGNLPMTSMSDCLLLCASQNIRPQGSAGPCQGVAWVYGKRQGVDGEACYLKYSKGAPDYETEKVESAWLV